MKNNLSTPRGLRAAAVGALMFLLPFLSVTSPASPSICSLLFLLIAVFNWNHCRLALVRHWPAVRAVALAFGIHFLYVALCFAVRSEASLSNLEKPLRMLLAISALALVLVCRPDRRILWWGAAGGAIAGMTLVAFQHVMQGQDRPGGFSNAITTGDLLLCLGFLCMAAVVDLRGSRLRYLALAGLAAGLIGAVLTGTRGGAVSLLLVVLLLIRYAATLGVRHVRAVLLLSVALAGASYLAPQTGVADRLAEAVTDVERYTSGTSAFTNVGIRLALWKEASLLIRAHPLFGVDKLRAKRDEKVLVDAGQVDPVVLDMPHYHNDALQVLVTGGVAGFAIWLATLVAPLVFFLRQLGQSAVAGTQRRGVALAGALVVVGYVGFGLTEVIFWSTQASLFYALTIFLLIGLCLNAKEPDGE